MAWPTITLRDLNHFGAVVAHIGTFGPAATTAYICRGQSSASWGLKPSLTRLLTPNIDAAEAARMEQDCAAVFSRQAHLHIHSYDLPVADDQFEWWALMQHHHAPTRLLDWTASPFVAAYFACEDRWNEDGVVWLVHPYALVTAMEKRNAKPMQMMSPKRPSSRMAAQQGLFMYSDDLRADHEPQLDSLLIHEHASGDGEVYRKIVIPLVLKPQLLRYLRTMNVTAAALFPGTDGLGRAANELLRLSQIFPRPKDRPSGVPGE